MNDISINTKIQIKKDTGSAVFSHIADAIPNAKGKRKRMKGTLFH